VCSTDRLTSPGVVARPQDFIGTEAARGMELSVVCPGFLLGPTLSGNDGSTSLAICVKLLTRAMPMVPGEGCSDPTDRRD
jgi:hypothetical protein